MRSQTFASPEEALAHYGKKGMRWGVRNEDESVGRDASNRITPPAPKPVLSERQQRKVEKFQQRSDVMSARIAEIKVRNEAFKGTRNLNERLERFDNNRTIKVLEVEKQRAVRDAEAVEKGKLTSNQKKVVIGVVAVSAILAAGAASQAVTQGQQSGAFNSAALRGSAFLQGKKVPFNTNAKLSGPMSAADLLSKVVKPVNPGYSTPGGQMNCRRSTFVYELRRRGFDVHATTSAVGWGQSESGVINAATPGSRNFYRSLSMSQTVVDQGRSAVASGDKRTNPLTKILLDKLDTGGPDGMTPGFGSKKVFEALGKQPNGSRGEVMFKFPGFGHSMAYEVVDNVPHVFDSQKGTFHDLTKTVESKWGSFSGAEITRLDNASLDLNFLTRWATNAERNKPRVSRLRNKRPSKKSAMAKATAKITPDDAVLILRNLGIDIPGVT